MGGANGYHGLRGHAGGEGVPHVDQQPGHRQRRPVHQQPLRRRPERLRHPEGDGSHSARCGKVEEGKHQAQEPVQEGRERQLRHRHCQGESVEDIESL